MNWKRSGYLADRAQENRAMVKSQCAPITITAADLIQAVDEDGVKDYAARALVERLIDRARLVGLAQTLGIEIPA